MNLNEHIRYEDYINEIAITIANDIEADVDSYSKEEKEHFINKSNKEDYYELQEWISTYTHDIEREVMIMLSHRLGFKYF
mgnify:CR=1 FL=1